jgi:hypothetical protein
MEILGIDPGGMNGLAWFGSDYQLKGFTQVNLHDFPLWLDAHQPIPDVVILENYRLWKHKALQQSGSDMPASQAIGMVKMYCKVRGITIVEQSPQILEPAQKMSQMPLPADHSKSHWVSAYNHVFWWLVKQGYRQVEMDAEDKF